MKTVEILLTKLHFLCSLVKLQLAGSGQTEFVRKFDSEGYPIFFARDCVLAFSVLDATVMKLVSCSMRHLQRCSGEKFDRIHFDI